MADYIDWPGIAGQYRYWFLVNPTPEGIAPSPGNYMFVRQTQHGYIPVYVGQAENLQDRIPNHERFDDAIKAGATHIMAHTSNDSEILRRSEERDLIGRWNPVCNAQYRT